MGTETLQPAAAEQEVESREPELALGIENPTYSVVIYPAKLLPKQYEAMIFSKWLRSLRFGNPFFKKIKSDEYYRHYHTYIENLMKKPDAMIRLAVLTEDQDVVLGFSMCREDVLDYIHVHGDYRKHGIGTKLMPPKITAMTHVTLLGMQIWQTPKYKHLEFNPFA